MPWEKPTRATSFGSSLKRVRCSVMKDSRTGKATSMPACILSRARSWRLNHWWPIGAMSHGNGASGEIKSASGTLFSQNGAREIRSWPLEPKPWRRKMICLGLVVFPCS